MVKLADLGPTRKPHLSSKYNTLETVDHARTFVVSPQAENKTSTDWHDRTAAVHQCKDAVGADFARSMASSSILELLLQESIPSHFCHGQVFTDWFKL